MFLGSILTSFSVDVSPNGYISDDIALKWLEDFDNQTREKANGHKRILFLDGHRSHHTWRFLVTAEAKGIICLGYPPHTTHALQRLFFRIFDYQPLITLQLWMLLASHNSREPGRPSLIQTGPSSPPNPTI
jgi:hypothetical protein